MDFEFPLPLDRQLGFGLYSAFMAVSRVYKPWLDQLGITYPQYLVLCVLWEGATKPSEASPSGSTWSRAPLPLW
jgi:hypothetical protein